MSTDKRPLSLYRFDEIPHDRKLHDGYMDRFAIRTEDLIVVIATLKPFELVPPAHRHPYPMLVIGLEGMLVLEVDGHEYEVTKDTSMIVPANAIHTGGARGDVDAKFIEIFSPVRRDYAYLTKYQTEKFINTEGTSWFYTPEEEKKFDEEA